MSCVPITFQLYLLIIHLQVIKITRYICLLVILPILALSASIRLNGEGSLGVPLFSVNYCGVFVPIVIIIESPQLRKFATASIKDAFNSLSF